MSPTPTLEGETTAKRQVKNKSKDLAEKGSQPWSEDDRDTLIQLRAVEANWKTVAEQLGRTNQACRSEFLKMKKGSSGPELQQAAEACEEQHNLAFPSSRAGNKSSSVESNEGSSQTMGQETGNEEDLPSTSNSDHDSCSGAAPTDEDAIHDRDPSTLDSGRTLLMFSRGQTEHEIGAQNLYWFSRQVS
jgi:hypothetical protein